MKAKVLDAKATKLLLARSIKQYDELHWAVAWGGWSETSKLLLRHSAKFKTVIFGVSFSQTHPDLIDALVGVRNAHVATRFSGGTFHPKIYCFRSGKRAAAIIGSANFTNGGLNRNVEGGIFLTGDADAPVFSDLFKMVRDSLEHCEHVTRDFARAYRLSYERAQRLPKAPRIPFSTGEGASLKAAVSSVAQMSWGQFTTEVRGSSHHDLGLGPIKGIPLAATV